MKRFFKIVSLFVTAAILTTAVGCSGKSNKDVISKIKDQGYIKMSTNAEFEPFEYMNGDDIVGIDIDIAKKIAEKLGVELKVDSVSFDALTFELKNDSCDFVMAGMSHTEERAYSVDFSDPYFSATQVIVVPKDSKIESSIDLTGKRVGVQLGTTSDSYCTDSQNMGEISEVVRFNKSVDAISDLLNNQIDAVVVDNFVADKFISKQPDKLQKLKQVVSGEEYRVAVKKGNKELLDFINNVITDLDASGEIEKIADNYISVD